MKKLDQRAVILIFTGISLLAMLILAASLNKLTLNPGQQLPLEQLAPQFQPNAGSGPDTALIEKILQYFFTVLWLIVPFYIIYLILNPKARKQFLKDLARLLPVMLLLLILFNYMQSQQGQQELPKTEMPPQGLEQTGPVGTQAVLTFNSNPPDWLVTATSLALAGIITVLVVGVIYFIYRVRKAEAERDEPLRKMAKEAQSAIDSIQAGGDLRDVIVRSYIEMTRILAESRNIQRGAAMTPHEFELYLEGKGIPREPVHNLTGLFEMVRYGGVRPGQKDEVTAISSLTAIANAVRRAS